MSQPLLKDVAEKTQVKGVYLCTRKNMPFARNGRAYLSLVITDRSAQLEARVWEQAEAAARRFAEFELVRIEGTAVSYQGRIQLHLTEVERASDEGLDPADFLPVGPRPVEALWIDLKTLAATVRTPPLRALIDAALGDETLAASMRRCPAAKTIHHAYVGGLLEHTLSVARLADSIATHYAQAAPGLVNRDLAVVGAILHDIGKTRELATERGLGYTDAGRLVGHIALGMSILDALLAKLPEFPEEMALRLRHVVLAHHGQLEFGSPKRPKTPEAFVVHYADQLDCQLGYLRDLFGREGERWTSYQKIYDRYFFRGDGTLAEEDGEGEGDEPA
jgi:3'-5' exoribonuclease